MHSTEEICLRFEHIFIFDFHVQLCIGGRNKNLKQYIVMTSHLPLRYRIFNNYRKIDSENICLTQTSFLYAQYRL